MLGLTADDFTDAERKSLGVGGGIKVASVRGPAEQAGIKAGDVLLELGGTPVTEETIGRTLEKFQPGDQAEAVLIRDKKRMTVKVTLAERKE
jgi:serine protease Do